MKEIFDAIRAYATAYDKLERIQRSRREDLPLGDQKTGVIGEFFAMLHARRRFPETKLEFGAGGWDICVTPASGSVKLIQVKAVSVHSGTSRISPIHSGWDELWLMRLDRQLLPEGFWTFCKVDVPWSSVTVEYSTMPRHGKPRSGSEIFRSRKDALTDLWQSLNAAHPPLKALAKGKLAPLLR
jgi:hypothetical protein